MRTNQGCAIRTVRYLLCVATIYLFHGAALQAQSLPDLTVTDLWESGGRVHFTIKNSGTATAGTGHTAGLAVDGTPADTILVSSKILPGGSYSGVFPKYYWKCTADGSHTVMVQADVYNIIKESNEKNNSRQETWVCDVTAPKITSGPTATNITQTSAAIIWTTDEGSDSVVWYGTTPTIYKHNKSNQTLTTKHEIPLDQLVPGTKYYYIVKSTDAHGNAVQSSEHSFQTSQATWPDLVVDDFWESNGTVVARIKNVGDATASAGHTAALYVDTRFVDSAYVSTTLAPGESVEVAFQQYQWQCTRPESQLMVIADELNVVEESDENNNSRQQVWTCDLTPPEITSGPEAMAITTSGAVIVWTTDEAGDSIVWYGIASGSYSAEQDSTALTTSHNLSLDSLDPDTTYYYFVQSTDAAGNTVSSGEHSFRTLPEQVNRPDLVVARMWRLDHAVHYEIANIGEAPAPGGHLAVLYMDGDRYDSERIDIALAPGESTEGRFPKFYFQCMNAVHVLTVQVDAEDTVSESDETNNEAEETVVCGVELRIVAGPRVDNLSPTTATILWSTNESADSCVEYDSHAKGFALRQQDAKLVENHEIRLTQLIPGTVYQYRVLSRTPEDGKVISRAAYFKTPVAAGNLPPVVKSLTFERQPTKMICYKMTAEVEDHKGIAYVQFFLDGALIGTDYSEPYECHVLPAALAMSRERFFDDHIVEAVAVNTAMVSASRLGFFTPAYECAAITAEFREPYPGDVLYVETDRVPAGTTVPIRVFAAEWDWNCFISPLADPHGAHPLICDHGYAPLREVRFYVNTFHIGTVTPSAWVALSHVYSLNWDVSGYRTGDYHIRVDAVAHDECIQTITRDFRIEIGEPRLELERYVTRHRNYFHVELRVRNRGTVPFRCDRIVDNVDGLQPIAKMEPSCEVTPIAATSDSRRYDVDINLHSGVGILYVEIPAYGSLTVDYLAVPVQLLGPGATVQAIGADPVRVVDYFSSDDWEFNRPCVMTEDDRLFTAEMDTAISGSDYLIVSNPSRLTTEFGSSRDVLCAMARLAVERNGILGYISGTDWNDPVYVKDTALRTWGASMDGGAYLSGGYLLLVGETEILPAWTVDIPDRSWSSGERTAEVGLSDLPYADMSGSDNAPELAVGRIIGNAAGNLIGAMETSIAGGYDRSFGMVTTGYEKAGDNFVARAWDIGDVWSSQADAGQCMTDGFQLHHWSTHVQKEQLVSGYDFPMNSGDGFLLANLSGTGVEAVRFGRYRAHVAGRSNLDLVTTEFYRTFACEFEAGDALACGDLDGDGQEEVVVGRIGSNRIVIVNDAGHGTPEFAVELEEWDVIACGDVWGDAREEIVVARRTGGGQVDVYSYDNSGTPSLTRVRTLNIPFTAWDGFAIGNVDTSNAGNEIIVGRDDDSRIYIYNSTGGAIADFPCDPYTSYDAMAVGDFDGDGADEIAVVIDDDVHGKRTLKIFRNNCWEADPDGGWKLRGRRHNTIYSRFLHFDGARTTGSSSRGDGLVAADIDGDGKEELALAHANHDRLYILDGHYTQGWKDRYLPVLQAAAPDIDVFVLCGHGNPGSCSPVSRDDVGTLSLSSNPIVYALSCLTGNYEGDWWWYDSSGARADHHDGDDGYAEAFFNSGAAVYIGSTEVSPSTMNNAAGPALMRAWDRGQTIGQALRDYKRNRAGADNWWRFWVLEYNLYGDPKYGALSGHGALTGLSEGPGAIAFQEASLTEGFTVTAASSGAEDVLVIDVNVPAYEVEHTGELDYVTIPGGDLVFEQGRPQVPYYVVTRDLPPGAVVQSVSLLERSGLETTDGLVLPLANCTPDLDGYEVTPAVSTFAGWFPPKVYDWKTVMNGDGSSTLHLQVYPFFYNSVTTAAQFTRQFKLAVEIMHSPVHIHTLKADKSIYQLGETVVVGLQLGNTGAPADVVVDAVVRRYGTDERIEGLLLSRLEVLMGIASFSPQWDSTGVEPGLCYIDVTVADVDGRLLDRKTATIRIDAYDSP